MKVFTVMTKDRKYILRGTGKNYHLGETSLENDKSGVRTYGRAYTAKQLIKNDGFLFWDIKHLYDIPHTRFNIADHLEVVELNLTVVEND